MFKFNVNNRLYLFFTGFILIQVFFLLFSESTYGYGGLENIFQYRDAKFSFEYPKLLFGGNSFYTLLLAPFSKFGYFIAKGFNLLLAVFTLLISARIVNKLFPGRDFFTLILIAFSPVFFQLSASCLPDILFGFLLVAAIYLFIINRFFFSALVISFVPFVLPQGFLILLVFAVVFILNQTYRFIPFLLTGIVLYSIVGFVVFGNFFWFLQNFQENMEEARSFPHHVLNIPGALGISLTILAVTGLIYMVYEVYKKFRLRNQNTLHYILIAGNILTFYFNTFFFRESSNNPDFVSATGAIIPLLAFTGMKTVEISTKFLKKNYLTTVLFSVFMLFQVIQLFVQNNLLLKATQEEQLMEKSAAYLRYNEQGSKLIYFNPLLAHFLEFDPFDESPAACSVFDNQQPSNSMDWGDILVWDSGFGSKTGSLELKNLEKDPFLKKVMSFKAHESETNSGEKNYKVCIYKKADEKEDSKKISDHYKSILSFEKYLDERVKEVDGMKIWELDSSQDYSPSIRFSPEVVTRKEFYEISANFKYKTLQSVEGAEVLFVVSVESGGETLYYYKTDLVSGGDKWEELHLNVDIPSELPEATQILVYVWNKERKGVWIEKIEVDVKSY
jgi:hypothetical protein